MSQIVETRPPAVPSEYETTPRRRRWPLLAAGSALLLVVVVASILLMRHGRNRVEYFTQPAARGDIRNVVSATGTLQAVVTVDVGSQVSGLIQTLYADYNSKVKQGQVLARIDPRPFQAQLSNATADLAAASAHVKTMQSSVTNQAANLKAAQANVEDARAGRDVANVTLQRDTALLQKGLLARSDFDIAKATADQAIAKYDQAQAALEQAQAQMKSSQSDLAQAQAQADQAKAAVETATLNLAYTTVTSPVDGVVVSRSVDVGQTVAASLQAPLLFVIANDLTKMQVNASVDEADVGQLSENQPVSFFVDAYPRQTFMGRIAEIRLNPQTVQNVVTYSVIVNVDNPDLKLRPGMTANITVTIAQRTGVLKVANAALRYQPAGMTRDQAAALLGERGDADANASAGVAAQPAAGVGRTPDTGTTVGTAGGARGGRGGRGRQLVVPPAAPPILAPGQHWNPADKIHFPAQRPSGIRPAIVWVLDAKGKPAARKVTIGITDGVSTEVVSGDLHPGDRVVIADGSQGMSPAQGGQRGGAAGRGGPGMFRF